MAAPRPGAPARPAPGPLVGVAATIVAVVVAALSPAAPTGAPAFDLVERVAAAALVAGLAWWAPRWVVVLGTAAVTWVAATGGAGPWILPALLGVAVVPVATAVAPGPRRSIGAPCGWAGPVAAALTLTVAFHLPDPGQASVPALVAAAVLALAVVATGAWRATRTWPRTGRWALGLGAGLAVVVVGASAVLTGASGGAEAQAGLDALRGGLDAAARGEQDAAVERFDTAGGHFDQARSTFGSWTAVPLRAVPLAGRQLDAAASLADLAGDLSSSAARTGRAVDLEGLRTTKGQVDLAAVEALEQPFALALTDLHDAERRLDGLDREWLATAITDRVDSLRRQLATATGQAQLAVDGVRTAPRLLGGDGARRYLVLVGNPSEGRPLGGPPDAYVVVRAEGGHLSYDDVGTIRSLQRDVDRNPVTLGVDAYPAPYLARRPDQRWTEVTAWSDFPTVARAARDLYAASGEGPVDGVLFLDPFALGALMSFTGPVQLPGGPLLDQDNAGLWLARDQYTNAAEGRERPYVDVLEQATGLTFQALLDGDLPGPREVASTLAPMVDQRRLLVESLHPEDQAFLERAGVRGTFPGADGGDLVSVEHSNAGGIDIDPYLTRSVEHRVGAYDPTTGAVTAETVVRLRNDAPTTGRPADVIGGADAGVPPGTNRLVLTLVSPLTVTATSVDGRPWEVVPNADGGVQRVAGPVDVPPGTTVEVRYRLDGRIAPGPTYRVAVLSQPGVGTDTVAIAVGQEATDACQTSYETRGGVRRWSAPAACA